MPSAALSANVGETESLAGPRLAWTWLAIVTPLRDSLASMLSCQKDPAMSGLSAIHFANVRARGALDPV